MKTTNVVCADCSNVVAVPDSALPVSFAYCQKCADRRSYLFDDVVTYYDLIEDETNAIATLLKEGQL